MLKKGLIGLVIIAVIGGGYVGFSQYQSYQRQEQVRLVKERNRAMTLQYIATQKEMQKKREEAKKFYEERRKRIEEGTAIVELDEGIDKYGYKYQHTLVDGKKEGKSLQWYKSGNKSEEANYKDNVKNGEYLSYYDNENNQLREKSFYLNGKLEGEQFSWHKNGGLSDQSFFSQENPKLHNKISWYENGIKRYELKFEANKNKFISRAWYQNGQLKYEFEKNEKEQFDGLATEWYESGQIKSRTEYKNGKSNGLCQNWNKEGELISENIVYDGRAINNDGFGKCD